MLTTTTFKQNIYVCMNTSRFYFFNSNIRRTQMHRFINNQGHEINLNIHAELAVQSGAYALTDTIKVMTITRVRAERGLILPETCPLQSMERGPPGLKVTLYH